MKNIVLIGMPGAGKSTAGVVLAKILGYEFIDSDLLIQKHEGRVLHELISMHGIDGFLRIEEQVNASIHTQNSVIATGGSVVYSKVAMEALRREGIVMYLRLSYPSVAGRLSDLSRRGVVLRRGQTLQDLYTSRCPLYERYADLTVDMDGLSLESGIARMYEAAMTALRKEE